MTDLHIVLGFLLGWVAATVFAMAVDDWGGDR